MADSGTRTKNEIEASLAQLLVEGAQLWIVTYSHEYGVDVWPRLMREQPDLDIEAEMLDSWEPDKESLSVAGPFDLLDPRWRE